MKIVRVRFRRILVILLTLGLTVSSFSQFPVKVYAYEEKPEINDIQEQGTPNNEDKDVSENNLDPEQDDAETDIQQGGVCNCTELCTEDYVNEECPVCKSAYEDCLHSVSVDTELSEEDYMEDYAIDNAVPGTYALVPSVDILYSTIWDGTAAYNGLAGEGTIDDPYLISCGQELEWFRIDVENGNNYSGKYVKLSKDIYLNAIHEDMTQENWDDNYQPANVWKGIDGFCGTFDGDGNTIFGLYMKNESDNTGLFNTATLKSKTVIKNLNLSHAYVSGTNNVGAIVGNGLWIYILNCSVDGVIKGTGSNVGGFIGVSGSAGWYGTTISDCHNNANISGWNNVGGFLGYSYIGNSLGAYDPENCNGTETITLTDLTNYGQVNGNACVGGIAGSIGRNMNCGGTVLQKLANHGIIAGISNSGGIFGAVEARYRSSDIIQASNRGNVIGSNYVGGIAGKCLTSDNNVLAFQNCYNQGTVSGTGIIGRSENSWGGRCVLLYCYNSGNVTEGDLVGSIQNNTWTGGECSAASCYYRNYPGVAGSDIIQFGEGDKGNVGKFYLFDFENIWKMTEEYPVFRWEEGEEIDTPENIMGRFKVYASCNDCTFGIGQCFGIRAAVIKKGEPVEEPDAYAYEIEDTSVVELDEVIYDSYGPTLSLKGAKAGSTLITFWHIPTGKKISVKVSVVDKKKVYDIRKLAALEYEEGSDKFIVSASLAVDNFHMYKNTDNTYTITFDAYNSLQHYAAVEVYDNDDNLIKVERINKRCQYQGSIKDVADSAYNLFVTARDFFLGDNYVQYKDPTFTEKTEAIKVEVPDGGKIFISNNYSESVGCFVYNAVDLSLDYIDKAKGLLADGKKLKEDGVIFKAYSEEVQDKTIEKLIEQKIADEYLKKTLEKFGNRVAKDEIGIDILSAGIVDLSSATMTVFETVTELDFGAILESCAQSVGFSIAEDIIETQGGPAGILIQVIFSINDYINTLMEYIDFITGHNAPGIVINVDSNDDMLISDDVIVENETGTPIIYDSLLVENVSGKAEHKYIYEDFESGKSLTIYNITLYKDEEEVQPDGRIRISVPLPSRYNEKTAKIYRVEQDGSYTDMRAVFDNGYMVFSTTHLSLYVCVADIKENDNQSGDEKNNKETDSTVYSETESAGNGEVNTLYSTVNLETNSRIDGIRNPIVESVETDEADIVDINENIYCKQSEEEDADMSLSDATDNGNEMDNKDGKDVEYRSKVLPNSLLVVVIIVLVMTVSFGTILKKRKGNDAEE